MNFSVLASRRGLGVAHGKAILLGEHSVVYGGPALALPVSALNVRAEVTPLDVGEHGQGSIIHSDLYHGAIAQAPPRLLPTITALNAALAAFAPTQAVTLRISSLVPAERGLGSSAAVAGAIVAAVANLSGQTPGADELHELIQAAERAAHGNPSGLDARAVIADRPIWFQQGESTSIPIAVASTFVLADTGVRGRTREAVVGLRQLHDQDAASINTHLRALDDLVTAGCAYLRSGDYATLGLVMNDAHSHLASVGVSDPSLDSLVSAARRAGALGAKLTGGGRGGCIITLAQDNAHAAHVAHALRVAGAAATWTTSEHTP